MGYGSAPVRYADRLAREYERCGISPEEVAAGKRLPANVEPPLTKQSEPAASAPLGIDDRFDDRLGEDEQLGPIDQGRTSSITEESNEYDVGAAEIDMTSAIA